MVRLRIMTCFSRVNRFRSLRRHFHVFWKEVCEAANKQLPKLINWIPNSDISEVGPDRIFVPGRMAFEAGLANIL
jgi:hypothetical protein